MAIRGLKPKYERELLSRGFNRIIGIDEVGRGAWAGPLVLGVFSYTSDHKGLRGVNDSKLVPRVKREKLAPILSPFCKTVEVSVDKIDYKGLGYALNSAINNILEEYYDDSTFFLIDGKFPKIVGRNFEIIVDGDAQIYSIAAASIVAKVYRDKLMHKLSNNYSKYGFETNVGYGTRFHRQAIKEHGICDIHRKSYRPIGKHL
jgi:ribonuclease HII